MPEPAPGALDGLRVLELGGEIAAPYCTKLLADLGADVIKVESPGNGDELRAWGPFPGDRPDPEASGLFAYLNAGKRSVALDLARSADVGRILELTTGADLVVENLRPGTLEARGLDFASLRAANSEIALVRISPFGQTGPYRDREVTDLTLQAAGAWVGLYNAVGQEPVRVGGRIPEYLAGSFAACSAITAAQAARLGREAVWVDLSMLECLVGTLAYPMLMHEALMQAGIRSEGSGRAPFGILSCKDGFIGINVLTQAHWQSACELVGVPEFADRRSDVTRTAEGFEAFTKAIRPYLDAHPADEILAAAQAARIPAAIVQSGDRLASCAQATARPFMVRDAWFAETEGAASEGFLRPGVPYRLSRTPASPHGPAPRLGEARVVPRWYERTRDPLGTPESSADPTQPFRGLRVLDLGTFWAGPYLGMYLASLGADVIKVESTGRPDGFRFVGLSDTSSDRWYERGVLFQATNLGKRNLTLDLTSEQGRSLLRRLISETDVLIENFAPRVMERFGFDYAKVRELQSDIVMLRMPAYGLDGPWRDYVGWALAIAQAAGISWLTGTPSGEPRNSGAFLDCAIGMHAGVALQAALAHRRRTGEGQLIEVAQFETALCICPEPVIDYSLNGRVQGRSGNRSDRFVPEGVYAARDGDLVALSVRDHAEWSRLVELLGKPAWSQDPEFGSAAARRKRHDEIDECIGAWTRERAAREVAELLLGQGIPAAELLVNARMYDEPQLCARAYYQSLEHPVSGTRRYPVWPMRFSFREGETYARPTPTLGQHNREILAAELGLDSETLAELERGGVIGQRWSPVGSA